METEGPSQTKFYLECDYFAFLEYCQFAIWKLSIIFSEKQGWLTHSKGND